MTRPVGTNRAGLKDRRWHQGKKPADGGFRRHLLFVAAKAERFNAENHLFAIG